MTREGLYVGGSFTAIDGTPRDRLGRIRPNGHLDANWRPRANGTVRAFAPARGRVYVGGLFTAINGRTTARYLGAISRTRSGLVTAFNPKLRFPVLGVDNASSAIYAGTAGSGGHLLAFGRRGHRAWHRATDGDINDVQVLDKTVYVAGHFSSVCQTTRVTASQGNCVDGGHPRGKLAAFGRSGGLLAWNPDADSVAGALALTTAGGRLWAGGAWTTFQNGSITRPHFAAFRT